MVQIENVSFGYAAGPGTLHNISFSAKQGECILLCGESGCGKTTVTKLINGLIPRFTEGADIIDRALYFQAGRITEIFSGEEFQNLSENKRKELGLRTLCQPKISLPKARKTDGGNGLMVKGLSCGYKKEPNVSTNLSFAAVPGEVLAVTGHNGTGKTTLMRCLCGLLKERSGTISLYGKPLKTKKRLQESFLVMQETGHQLFYDSVWNECEQASGEIINSAKIESILKKFDLLSFKEHHPMALSGGQKQRLAVATAMLSNKKLLIFDEPTSGLDYRHMRDVSAVIRDLAKQGHIILVVSHDNEFMTEACDRVLEI